jgi:hypothetical protein
VPNQSQSGPNTALGGANLQSSMYYVTGPIIDSPSPKSGVVDGVRVGTACFCMNRAVGTGDTNIAHSLGRIPNGYKAVRSSSGGVLYDASSGTTLWTPSNIVLRATLAGTYSIELI